MDRQQHNQRTNHSNHHHHSSNQHEGHNGGHHRGHDGGHHGDRGPQRGHNGRPVESQQDNGRKSASPVRDNSAGSPRRDILVGEGRRGNSGGEKHAHFIKHHESERQHGGRYHLPDQVYDRYTNPMDERPQREHSHGRSQYSDDTPVNIEQVTTLYIPKVKHDEGSKTLIRRRRTSSKRRSSSRKRHERENLNDLLNDEDNHLLPSLRFQRRTRMKSLKDRKNELEEEHRLSSGEYSGAEGQSFVKRYQDLKEQDDLSAGNFADLLRNSTLNRMQRLGDWKRPKKIEAFSRRSREFFQPFKLWVTSFKIIEGKFGTAVMSYFRFIRWLMFLNLFLMVIMFCVTTVPYLVLRPTPFEQSINTSTSVFHDLAVNCTKQYKSYQQNVLKEENTFEKVLDILQGTGWMERTILFYGRYHNRTVYNDDNEPYTYNMGLAYILAIGACFLVSFLLIVKNSAKTVKATFGMESSVAAYNNRVFAGWDYAISNKKAAKVKKANLYREYMNYIAEERLKIKRESRSANDKATLFFIRFIVNIVVLGLLVGALFLVYYTTDTLLELQKQTLNEIVALIVQYLPYLTITVLNFLIPMIFQKLVILEDYTHSNALTVTLARSILLRLASLGVLIISLYRLLVSDVDPSGNKCGNGLWGTAANTTIRGNIKCWETYVGQQIYKLVLLDLVVETFIIVFMQLPRRLLYNSYGETSKFIKKIGPQDFDLPQNVIDIIYSQTLCWIGLFFSPLIPFMTFLKCLLFFYLRKWTLLKNCTQTEQTYRTSKSHSLFMFVLLFSFLLASVPVGYMISSIAPSQSCGPFRVYSSSEFTMFTALSNVVKSWPDVLKDIILFLGTVGFFVPVILILCFLMYYFWLIGQGYKKREKMLSEQLKLEAKDKQFLLARVNEILLPADS